MSSSRVVRPWHNSPHATPGVHPATPRPVPVGGAGWRVGVPHIVIYAGDTVGSSVWPSSQNLVSSGPESAAHPNDNNWAWAWPFDMDINDWPADSFVQPASPRASGAVHVNLFKTGTTSFAYLAPPEWIPGVGDANGTWQENTGGSVITFGHERMGHVGDPWLYDSSVMATVPDALTALAELDINVMCLSGDTVEYEYDLSSFFNHPGYYNMTLGDLNAKATTPSLSDSFDMWDWWTDESRADMYGSNLALEGAAISHLTGAVGPDGKNLGWCLWRYPTAGIPEPVTTLAARIAADVIAHAGRLGNDQQFDVAFMMDDSGSFGNAQSRATSTFLAVIDAFLAEGRNIYVAMARYCDYAQRTHPNGNDEERPFSLQYPLAPISSPEDRAALIDALNTHLPGNGGGDTAETQWEALYQIASGAGLDANHNGSTADSGEAGVKGPTFAEMTPEQFAAHTPPTGDWYELSQGFGYYLPGFSGDVPAFTGVQIQDRGVATAGRNSARAYSHGGRRE